MIQELRRDSGKAKLPSVIRYIKDVLFEQNQKYLIFAHHRDILDSVDSVLSKAKVDHIRIDGETPMEQRKAMVDAFNETPNCKGAVLSLKAAGTGLNLTGASIVVFAELAWNPSDMQQAEDRAHRMGQTENVDH